MAKVKKYGFFRLMLFSGIYLVMSLVIVPLTAPLFGRVPLPLFNKHLKPLTIATVLLNRHYVKPQLLEVARSTSDELNKMYPGTVTFYLDANFPFFNGFPLIPHLSHNDGKKLDLAFHYLRQSNGEYTPQHPSPIGYGVFSGPLKDEQDQPERCEEQGFWQYSFMEQIVPQWNKDKFILDNRRTKSLTVLLASHNSIEKIFIEPHLKQRLGLSSPKIRYHGCRAVRHDDHIHIQVK
ncbi:hypothetical protein LVD17_18785 [Fulvivirga ulvae]|uniref:hypothetical protein n=1 Tax=Fulvivirga ulvae TaxID=2904245 RepID=UPI001F15CB0B|nr:hypothetical protein [Fulvivirga ulvae]UII30341.1 hypothetical protein LVD17_18785 [Fulvivirga ulvae]